MPERIPSLNIDGQCLVEVYLVLYLLVLYFVVDSLSISLFSISSSHLLIQSLSPSTGKTSTIVDGMTSLVKRFTKHSELTSIRELST